MIIGHGLFDAPHYQLVRKGNIFRVVTLGNKSRLPGQEFIELRLDRPKRSSRFCIVEPHYDLPLLDGAAFLNRNFSNDPPGRMLHFFDVRFDHDRAGCNHRAR